VSGRHAAAAQDHRPLEGRGVAAGAPARPASSGGSTVPPVPVWVCGLSTSPAGRRPCWRDDNQVGGRRPVWRDDDSLAGRTTVWWDDDQCWWSDQCGGTTTSVVDDGSLASNRFGGNKKAAAPRGRTTTTAVWPRRWRSNVRRHNQEGGFHPAVAAQRHDHRVVRPALAAHDHGLPAVSASESMRSANHWFMNKHRIRGAISHGQVQAQPISGPGLRPRRAQRALQRGKPTDQETSYYTTVKWGDSHSGHGHVLHQPQHRTIRTMGLASRTSTSTNWGARGTRKRSRLTHPASTKV